MLKFSYIRGKVLDDYPRRQHINKWLRLSLQKKYVNVIVSVSIVNQALSQQLNNDYRNINKATNIISLEYAASRDQFNFLSGELILCHDIIVREASLQNKSVIAHYAHMVVHGMLHLQGYDHQVEEDADLMENLEAQILKNLNFINPYNSEN